MGIEIKRPVVPPLHLEDTLKNVDTHRFPELAAVNRSPVPSPLAKVPTWSAPGSPRSTLDALDSPASSTRSLERTSSCSDLESLGSAPESFAGLEADGAQTLAPWQSVSNPNERWSSDKPAIPAYAEMVFPSGEHRKMSEAQARAFEQAWAKRAPEYFVRPSAPAVETWELRSTRGQRYFVTAEPLKHGTFAEFGLAVDDAGKRYGFRKVRMEANDQARTEPQSPREIHQEIRAMDRYTPDLKVIDTVRVDEHVYQIMPLMAGNVADLMRFEERRHQGAHRAAFVRHVGVKLCDALQHMHALGAVHGDQKASNALWDGDANVLLSDVGGATRVDDSGQVRQGGVPNTTPRYMAPEMTGVCPEEDDILASAMGEETPESTVYNQAVDIWSLAWLLLESRSGTADSPLNHVSSVGDAIYAHNALAQWRDKPSARNPWFYYFTHSAEVDPQLTHFVVSRMLAERPEERASLVEIRAFLQEQQARAGDDPKVVRKVFQNLAMRVTQGRGRHFASLMARRDAVLGPGNSVNDSLR